MADFVVQTTIIVFGCLQVALVSLWSLSSAPRARTSIAEPAVAVIETLAIGALSWFEHVKSTKPSALLNCYLVLTIILDIALTRTFWIRSGIDSIAGVFSASLLCKVVLLVLEEIPKKPLAEDKTSSRETSAGVVSRSVFWWLNRFFYLGARNLLTIDNLQAINPKFDSDKLLVTLEEKWQNGKISSRGFVVLANLLQLPRKARSLCSSAHSEHTNGSSLPASSLGSSTLASTTPNPSSSAPLSST